jgi:uncharacterized protein
MKGKDKMRTEFLNALAGGGLIGVATTILLLFNGRVTGISGIVSGAINPQKNETLWRWAFVLGLIVGGFVLKATFPEFFLGRLATQDWTLILAGALVGFGTLLGSGCTSGHGVCGISRFSIRSIIATVTFILSGIISIVLFRLLGVIV